MQGLSDIEKLVVLIVEDHPAVRDSIERVVEQWPNVEILSADNFFSAAIWINALARLDLLLCDVCLPGQMNGIDVANVAVATHPSAAVVIFSADQRSDIENMRDSFSFIQKPFDSKQFIAHIDNAFGHLHAKSDLVAFSAV